MLRVFPRYLQGRSKETEQEIKYTYQESSQPLCRNMSHLPMGSDWAVEQGGTERTAGIQVEQ